MSLTTQALMLSAVVLAIAVRRRWSPLSQPTVEQVPVVLAIVALSFAAWERWHGGRYATSMAPTTALGEGRGWPGPVLLLTTDPPRRRTE